MIEALYAPFRHWSETGTIWIYSDPHFNDDEMCYLRKNYIGDDEQVKRINAKVGKKDTLIILGDVGDVSFVKKLRGYKVLIMGNHDAGATTYQRKEEPAGTNPETGETYTRDNGLFDEVFEGPVFITEKLLLSHEPVALPFAFNIHGHDHSNWSKNQDFQHMNVCAEHIDYTPVNFTHLIKYGLLSKVESIHRVTIDGATERKKNREARGLKKGDKCYG